MPMATKPTAHDESIKPIIADQTGSILKAVGRDPGLVIRGGERPVLVAKPVSDDFGAGDEGKGEKKRLQTANDGALSEEQFREWVNRRSHLPLAVKGHTFVLMGDNVIAVDGGKFVYEEALELVKLLNSKSPFSQMNATFMISERNGALRLVVVGLIAIVVVVVILLARR
jgi:hypothetical protein